MTRTERSEIQSFQHQKSSMAAGTSPPSAIARFLFLLIYIMLLVMAVAGVERKDKKIRKANAVNEIQCPSGMIGIHALASNYTILRSERWVMTSYALNTNFTATSKNHSCYFRIHYNELNFPQRHAIQIFYNDYISFETQMDKQNNNHYIHAGSDGYTVCMRYQYNITRFILRDLDSLTKEKTLNFVGQQTEQDIRKNIAKLKDVISHVYSTGVLDHLPRTIRYEGDFSDAVILSAPSSSTSTSSTSTTTSSTTTTTNGSLTTSDDKTTMTTMDSESLQENPQSDSNGASNAGLANEETSSSASTEQGCSLSTWMIVAIVILFIVAVVEAVVFGIFYRRKTRELKAMSEELCVTNKKLEDAIALQSTAKELKPNFDDSNKKLQDDIKRLTGEVEQYKNQYEEEKEAKKRLEDEQKESKKRLEDEQQDFKKRLDDLKQDYESRIKEVKIDHKASTTTNTQQWTATVNDLRAQVTLLQSEMKAKDAELANLEKDVKLYKDLAEERKEHVKQATVAAEELRRGVGQSLTLMRQFSRPRGQPWEGQDIDRQNEIMKKLQNMAGVTNKFPKLVTTTPVAARARASKMKNIENPMAPQASAAPDQDKVVSAVEKLNENEKSRHSTIEKK